MQINFLQLIQNKFWQKKNKAVLANPQNASEISAEILKKHSMNWTMQMTLTDEKILENREFFNGLFQKHGIDYSV